MRVKVTNRLPGDTIETTWVCSGMFPAPITSALIGPNRTVINSMAAVSSGHGFYFSLHQLPTTPGQIINEWRAWINSYEYVNRQIINVQPEVVDG